MVLYKGSGICSNGYYAGFDGFNDLQSCLNQCLAEPKCLYVSFAKGSSCSRFKNQNCETSVSHYIHPKAKDFITYLKIKKGTCMALFDLRYFFSLMKLVHALGVILIAK